MINEPVIIKILKEIASLPDVIHSGYDQNEGAYWAEMSDGNFIARYAFDGDDEVQANEVLAEAKAQIKQMKEVLK